MKNALFEGIFPSVSKKEWIEKIKTDLRGISYESLDWEASPQINVDPLYTLEDQDKKKIEQQRSIAGNRTQNNWLVRQTLTNPNKQQISAKGASIQPIMHWFPPIFSENCLTALTLFIIL